ncbi:hypothetical protein [Clostridium lundense]|uniref:hypothetical protein n=1 Tax=Clostridium lundense TaxID=319475 RepID=UPI0004857B95|nr:hypothetical protein [Clostridium lundense]
MININRCILGEECEIIKVLPKEDMGTVYMNPKYIEGKTLENYINGHEGLDTKTIFNIASSICDIIEHVYNLNLTIEYKDLKPSKIIITPNDKVILVDVGLLKLYKVVENKYIAIESIGKIIYYMTTGRIPFTAFQPSLDVSYESNVDNNLRRIIRKCFAVNGKNRYASVEELNREIIIEMLKINKNEKEITKSNHNIKLNMTRKNMRNNKFKIKKSIENMVENVTLNIEEVLKKCKAVF